MKESDIRPREIPSPKDSVFLADMRSHQKVFHRLHTHEHRGANTETAGQNKSANLSQEVAEETANMAESPSHVNEPLEFGFIATCWDCKNPKELRGNH